MANSTGKQPDQTPDNDFFSMVGEFHDTFDMYNGLEYGPHFPPDRVMELRNDLLVEELKELIDAVKEGDLTAVADALADTLYVTYGWAIAYGIDIRPIFREVHRSNMEKLGGGKREDGKILKPRGWNGPKVHKLLKDQMDQTIIRRKENRHAGMTGTGEE